MTWISWTLIEPYLSQLEPSEVTGGLSESHQESESQLERSSTLLWMVYKDENANFLTCPFHYLWGGMSKNRSLADVEASSVCLIHIGPQIDFPEIRILIFHLD